MKRSFPEDDASEPKRLRGDRFMLTKESWIESADLPDTIKLTEAEFEELWESRPEEKGKFKMMGKMIDTPRRCQTFGKSYYFGGVLHECKPMTPVLQRLMDWCLERSPTLNGCLVNWYENENDYIGPHSDNESSLVVDSEIFSFSFGATREFVMIPKKGGLRHTVQLRDNTVVIMGGTCQRTHKHTVPKSKVPCGRRINITFRSFRNRK